MIRLLKKIIKKTNLKKIVYCYKNSSFYKRKLRFKLLKSFPSYLNIELTNKCNLKCYFCPHSFLNLQSSEIEWKVFDKFINDIKELQEIAEIVPVGLGEPFLYSRWENAFGIIKNEFPTAPLRIVSNGTLINERVGKIISKLFDNRDSILISINTLDRGTYKKMMGSDLLEKVIENIINLIKIRKEMKKEFSIKTQLLLTSKTEKEKESFERFWSVYLNHSNDIPLYLRRLENWGG